MKRLIIALLVVVMLEGTLSAFQAFSRLASVEPDTGKTGDAVSAKGENLGKSKIGELYLTDGKLDVKATITEQSDSEIKFTIPKIQAGRYRLMLVTAKKDSMIEQPVMLTVE